MTTQSQPTCRRLRLYRAIAKPLPMSAPVWLCLALLSASGIAYGNCDAQGGRLESSEGRVAIENKGSWQTLNIGDCIPAGTRVRIDGGRAVFRLANETLLRASGATLMRIQAPQEKNWIHLSKGLLHFITRTPRAFDVQTDYVNAGVKGTEFILAADNAAQRGEIIVIEGEVLASNAHGQQSVRNGGAIAARAGQAPQALTIPALRNAVQWTLYYPPLPFADRPAFQAASAQLYSGDATGAIKTLGAIPTEARNADYYTQLAATNLYCGEIKRARRALYQALKQQPDHPQALALRATTLIAIGDIDQAGQLLDRAATSAPRDTSVLIARSYLAQARFDLPTALATAEEAAALEPDNALVQTRLAELALINGDTTRASAATAQALARQPEFARAHAIDGFIHLQRYEFDAGETAFQRAIKADPRDPLPHLGLGLIAIRHNKVTEGREQLALAAALDPGQSLLRSYLGKAYQEEERDAIAADQYELAKALDPSDPTPWLYSALQARTQNRPFAALDDLNRSIELNDNRAVYRSRLQLDADEAARTASQADIYRELGFDELAQRTAARAVTTAPAEYGGHRQLAEAYADDPQYDAARASEVLQAQLLQPLSASPILPILGETNLIAIQGAGPAELGFGEYNAMFVREKPWLSVSGLGGSNQMGAGEVTLSGVEDRYAYALNRYHYETLGYRENGDSRYDVTSAYGKMQLNERLSFFLSLSERDEDRGEITEHLFWEQTRPIIKYESEVDSLLAGAHFKATPNFDFLMTFSYKDFDEKQRQQQPTMFGELFNTSWFTGNVNHAETQALINTNYGRITAGFNWSEIDNRQTTFVETTDPFLQPVIPIDASVLRDNTRYSSGYGYWSSDPVHAAQVTLGLSSAEFDNERYTHQIRGWYPKIALTYRMTPRATVRAAYYQTLSRPRLAEQTLEPTLIGGFNQMFDDTQGTESEQYGIGFDFAIDNNQSFGAEGLIRHPDILAFSAIIPIDQKQAKLYWNWANAPWAINLSYRYEDSENSGDFDWSTDIALANVPNKLTTHSLPLELRWFNDHGLSLSGRLTYFKQSADRPLAVFNGFDSNFNPLFSTLTEDTRDAFTTLDLGMRYKFWGQHAEAALNINNVLEEDFRYQNTNLYDETSQMSPYIPERTVWASIKIAY